LAKDATNAENNKGKDIDKTSKNECNYNEKPSGSLSNNATTDKDINYILLNDATNSDDNIKPSTNVFDRANKFKVISDNQMNKSIEQINWTNPLNKSKTNKFDEVQYSSNNMVNNINQINVQDYNNAINNESKIQYIIANRLDYLPKPCTSKSSNEHLFKDGADVDSLSSFSDKNTHKNNEIIEIDSIHIDDKL
jgi:hypothetical protein